MNEPIFSSNLTYDECKVNNSTIRIVVIFITSLLSVLPYRISLKDTNYQMTEESSLECMTELYE